MALLTKINKEDIKEVIRYSQNIEEPKIDNMLAEWDKNKYHISQTFFKGEVSYTHPEKVHFEIDEDTKNDKLGDFTSYLSNVLGWSHPLIEYINTISADAFYNNTLEFSYTIDERENKTIPKGSKILKSFKHFIDNEILLHDIQNKASELIQENKVEGYLTFSIHPLDFFSASENSHNWRSCHALDGEYRAGNLSYICDHSTVMVYLSNKENCKLPGFPTSVPWNSKKWRMLLHFDDRLEVVFAGKQYPFNSLGALEKVGEVFFDALVPESMHWGRSSKPRWSKWHNDYIQNFEYEDYEDVSIDEARYCVINGGIFDKYKIVVDVPNPRHYNDVLRSSTYIKPYYMFKKLYAPRDILVEVGSPVKCLRCGEEYVTTCDTMMCKCCEEKYGNSDSDEWAHCDCCGRRYYYSDGYWLYDDCHVCPECADKETFVCEDCGNRVYNSEKVWDDEIEGYICLDCKRRKEED